MADIRHLENREIAISYDNAKQVSLAHRRSAILDFKLKFFNGQCISFSEIAYILCRREYRLYCCRDKGLSQLKFVAFF